MQSRWIRYLTWQATCASRIHHSHQSYSTSATNRRDVVTIVLENGFPNFHIPLPSRREVSVFTIKPLQHTIGDLTAFIMEEDGGVDRVAFITKDGNRIAKSNCIADILSTDFRILINDDDYLVDCSSIASKFHPSATHELADVRLLISRLASTLHADEFYQLQQRELERRIEDIFTQLQPLEQQRQNLSVEAAKRTRRLTWLGLGAMGLQFGFLARLTWWEYSWDIMEPVTYFVGYGTAMAMYAYYVITQQTYEFPQVFDREYLKRFYKLADRKSFDVNRYNNLRDQLADLQSELRRLRDPLLCNLPLQQTGYLKPEQTKEILDRGPPFTSNTNPVN